MFKAMKKKLYYQKSNSFLVLPANCNISPLMGIPFEGSLSKTSNTTIFESSVDEFIKIGLDISSRQNFIIKKIIIKTFCKTAREIFYLSESCYYLTYLTKVNESNFSFSLGKNSTIRVIHLKSGYRLFLTNVFYR